MDEKEFRSLDLQAKVVPSSARWPQEDYLHWQHLHAGVAEAHSRVEAFFATCDEIAADVRLSAAGRKEERKKAGAKALAGFAKSPALHRAQDSTRRQLERWEAVVDAAIKPAQSG